MKKTKRFLSVLLTLCMVLGILPGTVLAANSSMPFTDVKEADWCYEAVQYVYKNGMMNGTSDTTFSPNATTTRGMIVTILHRMEGTPYAAGETFTDVAAGRYCTDAVAWASANGIVGGYGNGKFGPDDPITRQQMAAILYRYAQYKDYDVSQSADLSKFTDAGQVSSYAKPALSWANAEGLINGVTQTTLVPQGNATRAQVATILMRFCENIAQEAGANGNNSNTSSGNNPTYTVTFDSNGGSAVETQVIKKGATVTEPEVPALEGYTFAGWYTDVGLTEAYDFTTPVTADISLYAAWEKVISSQLSISIEQSDSTVTCIHQTLNGTFIIENAVLETISCTAFSRKYPENKYEIGELLIDESDGTWTLTDIRLYPGENEIILTISDIEGNQANAAISVTYDGGSLANYDDSEIVYFDDESGTGYVNDIILIVIDASLSTEDRNAILQEVCSRTNGNVIGQLNGSIVYQIQVEACDYEELVALCDDISDIDGVTANCDYIVPAPDDEVEPADEEERISESVETTFSSVRATEARIMATSNSMTIPDDPWKDVFQGAFGQNWNEDDPSGLNWWVEAVRAPSAWSYSDKMSKITVGIVDTGIDTAHKDLQIDRTLTTNVAADHGTHVAGIIGATANNDEGITGLVWNKTLYGYDAYQGAGSSSKIIEGIEALISAGARVINDSNGTKLDNSQVASEGSLKAAIVNNWANVITENFIIVQAAGNDNVDSRRAGSFASVTDADALEHIIIVAATEKPSNGNYTLTDFSNYGSGVTIAAPGRSIFSSIVTGGLDGDYGKKSGTSMASPIVTGVTAMVWSIDPSLTAAEVKQIVVNTATTEVSGYNDNGTYYMVDACAAVEEAVARTYGDGIAEGYFVDATTGVGLQVGFRIHKSSVDGEIMYSGTSGPDGYFWFEVPAGDYVIEAYGDQFITSYTVCTIKPRLCKFLGDIPISTEVDENTYRIVLEWGATPTDLDSHLVADTLDGSTIHVYYSRMTFAEANLDIDDVSSYGPETITVTGMENLNGFTYSVHNFSNRSASSGDDTAYNLAKSDAIVKVYKANTLIATYEIPTNRAGTVWNVFSIDANGNITELNTFEYISDPGSVGAGYASVS